MFALLINLCRLKQIVYHLLCILCVFLSGEASICCEAPSLTDLCKELAQYEDLLNDSTSTNNVEGSQELGGLHIELICQTKLESRSRTSGEGDDKIDMDLVQQLGSIFMPPPSNAETNDFCKRPTAASLGLRETIQECLQDQEDSTGNTSFN